MRQFLLLVGLGLGLLWSGLARSAPGHLDRVIAASELRVCVWPDYHGISYRNPRTRQVTGMDADMARALANDLGVALRFVDSAPSTLIHDLDRDRCDIAMFGVGITPARAEKLHFAQPYLVSDIHAVTTDSNRRIKDWSDIDKPGVVVAVLRGTIHEPVLRERLKAATLLLVDSPQARDLEVQSGRADLFMTDLPYSQRMIETVDWARVVSPHSAFHRTQRAYATQAGDVRWHGRVDQFVAAIKRDGRLLASARIHKLEPLVAAE